MVRTPFLTEIAMSNALLDEMSWRGLIAQSSDYDRLSEHLNEARTLYCGFDPTADSLHIGNLVPLLTLRRFQEAGHRPIVLLGGATGLVGDPSGRDDERSLNDESIVAGWVDNIRRQTEKIIDFDGGALIANNLDWTSNLGVIPFLRDIGKYFSVNAMIQRDSVRTRLERADQGISYTEFSYMLLQGMDYLELAKLYQCSLQIGGSDQWGNIVSGVDLVRRHLSEEVFAMTLPLVTKADGTKFGKTAGGSIWLDSEKTSPYSFYQFWLNAADADAANYLKIFTFVGQEEIAELEQSIVDAPEKRAAQNRLAEEVTRIVHGEEALASAKRITDALFGGELSGLTETDFAQLSLDGLEVSEVNPGDGLLSIMAEAQLAKSVGEARKLVQGGGVRINGEVIQDHQATVSFDGAFYGRYLMLKRGKKVHHLLVKSDT